MRSVGLVPRRFAPRAMLLLAWSLSAHAGGGKAGKALKYVDAFEAGDREALAKAVALADAAVADGDAFAWSVRGRAYLLLATNPDVPSSPGGDPAAVAVEAFEKAVAAGAEGHVHAAMARDVPVLESTIVAALVNDVEGKQWNDARVRLDLALRVHALGEKLGGRDPDREAAVRRLAVQVTAQSAELDAARDHYAAFVAAAGRHDSAVASLVARKLADAGDRDAALAFLAPLDAELADDERLLRTEVDLLTAAGRKDEAVARVGKAEERLSVSPSGAFLAAGFYAELGAEEKARAMWERVVALDATHVDARVALGRSLTALAAQRRTELLSLGEDAMREKDAEVDRLRAEVTDAWSRAEQHLLAARAASELARPPVEASIALYEAQVADLEGVTLDAAGEAEAAARRQKLADAKAALAALGEG